MSALVVRILGKIWLKWLIQGQKGSRQEGFKLTSTTSMLFVELTKFGDVVSILPALQSFHKSLPQASIAVAVQARFAELFHFLSFPIEIIPLHHTQRVGGFFHSVTRIDEKRYDLAISMSPGIRNGILTLSTDAQAKIGYFDMLDSVTPFLNKSRVKGYGIELATDEEYGHENISHRAKKICSSLGIPWHDSIVFEIPQVLKETIRKQIGMKPRSRLVILHPFAGWKYREWNIKNFISIASKLREEEHEVIIIGTEDELANIAQVSSLPSGVKLFDAGNIPELLALYSMASLHIGNDSGPLHLASTVGVPCVGLYGPASPDLTAPVKKGNLYCYQRVECSPCDQRKCIHPEHPCMELISVDQVLNAAHTVLQASAKAS